MSVTYRIEIDDRQVQSALDRLIATGQSPREIMRDIAAYGESSTKNRFTDGVGPDGVRWKPLKNDLFSSIPKKHLRKDGRLRATRAAQNFVIGRKILIKEAILVSSIAGSSGNDYAEWGSNVIYAAIHQAGGKAGRGHKAEIPARPYLGINEQDEENIIDIVNSHLQNVVNI